MQSGQHDPPEDRADEYLTRRRTRSGTQANSSRSNLHNRIRTQFGRFFGDASQKRRFSGSGD